MNKESKHEAFLRLAQVRTARAMEELRLVSQLSGRTYENSPEEAEQILTHLDKGMKNIADSFDIAYSAAIGDDAEIARRTGHLITSKDNEGPINELDVAYAIERLKKDDPESALNILKAALSRKAA